MASNLLHYFLIYAGHKAYLGFLYMELAYNHPVVHVFVKTVMESIQKRKVQRRKEAHSDDIAVVEANQFAPAGERWNTVECIRPKECSLRIMSRPEYWIAIANVCKSQGQIQGGGVGPGGPPPPPLPPPF